MSLAAESTQSSSNPPNTLQISTNSSNLHDSLTPLQREIHYLIHTEMPVKLRNMRLFLTQFIKLVNPSSRVPDYVMEGSREDDGHESSANGTNLMDGSATGTVSLASTTKTPEKISGTVRIASPSSAELLSPESTTTTPRISRQGSNSKDNTKSMKFRIGNIAVGHFQISGFTLTHAKLNLKTSAGSHIHILQQPQVLFNLQKAHHLAVEALNRINRLVSQRERDLKANISNKKFLEKMYRLLMEEARLMIQVKEHLETDFDQLSCPLRMQLVIPYASVERMQNSFQPPLPRDCLLEFSVQQSRCTVTVYKLLFANPHRLKDIVHRLHAPTRQLSIQMPDTTQHGYIYQVHRTELMDNKHLQDAVLAIRNAYQTCSRLKDKLDLLKDFDE